MLHKLISVDFEGLRPLPAMSIKGIRVNCTKMIITPQTEIFQGMFDTIINFTPCKFHVNL